jgi:hypothetical protein
MRASFALIAILLLSNSGCASPEECLLHSMIDMFPTAYSGGGATAADKHADLDQNLHQSP